ncbi:MAG: hypothetical protein JNM24_19910 [Bdellovibrionaceae bacterium]|nr:hypothetical protein [Pseudobdellovibrionaceae bacterium]
MKYLILLFVLGLFMVGCTTGQIIEKKEYLPSTEALKKDNRKLALNHFPAKEEAHFIPLLEKVYLQLIDDVDVITKDSKDTTEFTMLLRESRKIERNEKLSISNEIDQLFFIKTDEGYYPANHEIFWMHLLLGLTFAKKNQIASARVEAKRISELFARVDMSGKPFYDNAGIRILSAMLWAACGEQENAIVDLRRAEAMGGFIGANQYENKPINWNIVFKGTGFAPDSDSSSFSDKISGFKAIQFKSEIPEKKLPVVQITKSKMVFSSQPWHKENLIRNETFKETIQKSKYMSRMFKSELEYQSLNLITSVATGVVLATGITVGVAIVGGGIYLAAQSGATGASEGLAQIIGIGFIAGTEIYNAGIRFYDSTQTKIQSERKEFQDVSRFYRYVRFIPDFFILETDPSQTTRVKPFFEIENQFGRVHLSFEP